MPAADTKNALHRQWHRHHALHRHWSKRASTQRAGVQSVQLLNGQRHIGISSTMISTKTSPPGTLSSPTCGGFPESRGLPPRPCLGSSRRWTSPATGSTCAAPARSGCHEILIGKSIPAEDIFFERRTHPAQRLMSVSTPRVPQWAKGANGAVRSGIPHGPRIFSDQWSDYPWEISGSVDWPRPPGPEPHLRQVPDELYIGQGWRHEHDAEQSSCSPGSVTWMANWTT